MDTAFPPMRKTIKLRRDTADRWHRLNPQLSDGEPGYEKDTGKFKIGDGSTLWRELPYFIPGADADEASNLAEHIADETPHPVYDDGPDLALLYENAKV